MTTAPPLRWKQQQHQQQQQQQQQSAPRNLKGSRKKTNTAATTGNINKMRSIASFLLASIGAAAYVVVFVAVYRAGRDAASLRKIVPTATTEASVSVVEYVLRNNDCLNATGPAPVVLLSRGRSGTGSMWQLLGSLTGMETPSDEYTGSNREKSETFFHNVGPNDGGRWVLDVMCHYQRTYADAAIVGFKWKPFRGSFFSDAARNGLELIAALAREDHETMSLSSSTATATRSRRSAVVKVVRSRRNPLDVLISQTKHRSHERAEVAPHCTIGDGGDCLRKQLEAGSALRLPTSKGELVSALREASKLEDDVDDVLRRLGVPFVETTFERTHPRSLDGVGGGFSGEVEATEEWMRIFRFLGVGPTDGLTPRRLAEAMRHVPTSRGRHNETLANYDEVRLALAGTDFERLLH